MELQAVLEETFSSNFVAYYQAHQAHVNIRGRNFYSDHKLLQKIYEALQEHIDDLGEKLRTIHVPMPESLEYVAGVSVIPTDALRGSADELLQGILDTIMSLLEVYHRLDETATEVSYTDISNMAQDHIGTLAKFKWMLQSTLEIEDDES
jgi:DNA-binding ferritin-like protein